MSQILHDLLGVLEACWADEQLVHLVGTKLLLWIEGRVPRLDRKITEDHIVDIGRYLELVGGLRRRLQSCRHIGIQSVQHRLPE